MVEGCPGEEDDDGVEEDALPDGGCALVEMVEVPPSTVSLDRGGVPPCADGDDGGHLSATLLASCMLLPSRTDSVGGEEVSSVLGGLAGHLVTVFLCPVLCLIARGDEDAVVLLVLKGGLLGLPGLLHADDGDACLPVAHVGCLLLPGVRAQACTAADIG